MLDGHLWNANFLAQNAINVSLCKGSASVEFSMMISTQLILLLHLSVNTRIGYLRNIWLWIINKYNYDTEKSILRVKMFTYVIR